MNDTPPPLPPPLPHEMHPYPPPYPPSHDTYAGPLAEPKKSRTRQVVAGGLIAVVVAAAVAGGILAFRFARGSADTMASMAPSDAAVYFNANLDPSGSQKMALNDIFSKFPSLRDATQRDTLINQALDGLGMQGGFNHGDVRPWLGSQIALVAQLGSLTSFGGGAFGGGSNTAAHASPFAILLSSADDTKAQAALNKLRTSPWGSKQAWSTSSYDGVQVTTGQGDSTPFVWAIVNHNAVLGGSAAFVDEIIDTAHGKHASLDSTSDFQAVNSQLPSARFAFLYLNFPMLAKQIGPALGLLGGGQAQSQLALLSAYRGIGFAAVASSDGLAIDGVTDFDSSKLPADVKALLNVPPDQNGALGFVPSHAYGFAALTGVPQLMRYVLSLVSGFPNSGGISSTLDQLGITGPNGIINHLTGDAGVEVDALPGGSTPAGAILFATDSGAAAQGFLDNLAVAACHLSHTCDPSQATKQSYSGVTISSLATSPRGQGGGEAAWAVVGNWGVFASSADEVKAVIDSHAGGGITTNPNYQAISSHIDGTNNGVFYVNIQAIVAAIRGTLSTGDRAIFDTVVAPNLNPIKAFALTQKNFSDHTSSTLFFQIG